MNPSSSINEKFSSVNSSTKRDVCDAESPIVSFSFFMASSLSFLTKHNEESQFWTTILSQSFEGISTEESTKFSVFYISSLFFCNSVVKFDRSMQFFL